MSEVNVPKLRFREFEGEWKVVQLSEITKINQGLQIPISERYLEKVSDSFFYITNEFLRKNSDKRYFIKNPPLSVICTKDDILMTRTGNTGQVVTGVDGAFHNNFFKIKYDKSINKDFFVYFLRLKKTQNMILRLAGTSTIPDLNHGDFYKLKIKLPQKPEQQKIANFLTSIDQKIEQLTKKEKLLVAYKKGVMQKIFSRQIRFRDENGEVYGDWVERKLGEIFTFLRGSSLSKADIIPNGKKECIHYGELFTVYNEQIFTIKSKTNLKEGQFSKIDDILMPSSDVTPQGLATSSALFKNDVIIGGDINILRPKIELNSLFVSYFLNVNKNEIMKLVTGTTVKHIYNKDIAKLKINLPSKAEQTKIANFLSSIDKKIEQVNRQIEESKGFKNGLLQQMFV